MSNVSAGSRTPERVIAWAAAGFGTCIVGALVGVAITAGAAQLIEWDWRRSGHVLACSALAWWTVFGISAHVGQCIFGYAAPGGNRFDAAKGFVAGGVGLALAAASFAGFLTEWSGDSADLQQAFFVHLVGGGAPAALWFLVIGFNKSAGATRLAKLFGRWAIAALVFNAAVWLTGCHLGLGLPSELGASMVVVGAMFGYLASMDEDSRSDDMPAHLREVHLRWPHLGWLAHVAVPMMTLGPAVTSLLG